MINRMSFTFFYALVFCFMLTACDDAPTPQQIQPSNKKAAKSVKPDSDVIDEPQEIVYVYDPTDTRDPFESPFSIVIEIQIEDSVPLTPLQKIDLDQLRLIGLIIGKGAPRAMVIAPDGKSFILKNGVKIGRNNGVVAEITTEAVLVEEQYLDFVGGTKKRIQKIKLPKREE